MRPTALPALLVLLLAAGCAAPAAPDGPAPAPTAGPGPMAATPVEQMAVPPEARAWPDLAAATIRPGVGVQGLASYVEALGPGCTSNFVFTDGLGRLYLGAAAHCFDEGEAAGSGGRCAAVAMPVGTEVHVAGATRPGRLAYTSTEAMGRLGTKGEDICQANDFALIQIDAADAALVHPAVLDLGGPTAVAAKVGDGLTALTVGASPFRPGPAVLDHAQGPVEQTRDGGWVHSVGFTPQRIPGDSGSPVVAEDGTAIGVVGDLALSGNDGVVDLRMALDFARQATGLDLRLATWERLG